MQNGTFLSRGHEDRCLTTFVHGSGATVLSLYNRKRTICLKIHRTGNYITQLCTKRTLWQSYKTALVIVIHCWLSHKNGVGDYHTKNGVCDYHTKMVWWLSYKNSLGDCHTKMALMTVIKRWPWWLSYKDGLGDSHIKMLFVTIIRKWSWWLSYKNGLGDCHTKNGLVTVIQKMVLVTITKNVLDTIIRRWP